jgi:hypothetical protein
MIFYMQRVLVPYQQHEAAKNDRPRGNLSDLYPRWLGARELLLKGRDPYSAAVTRDIQTGFYGRPLDSSRRGDPKDQQAFAYPVYVVFILAPTVLLPFSLVQPASFWLLLLFAVGSVPLWLLFLQWRPSRSALAMMILLTGTSFAVIQGVKLQQLTLLVAGLIALAAALLARDYVVVPGILMAVATIKPQLAAPVSGWLFLWALSDWRNRKRFVVSFALTLGVLLAAAEFLLPGWMTRFQEAVIAYRAYTGNTGSVIDSLVGQSAGRVATLCIILVTLFVCWKARKSSAAGPYFARITLLILSVTVVVIPTIVPYNQVLLLPAVLQIAREWPQLMKMRVPGRIMTLFCGASVAWPWLGACFLMIISIFLPQTRVQELWSVPLYSSLLIPLCVLLIQGCCLTSKFMIDSPPEARLA